MSVSPKVSIVVATFNRSNVLRHTIASVIESTFGDWEMIVVGDACTDDTESVVGSFGDSRISFVNLESNWGEQSKPNNEGFARSKGAFVAFLNHDDLSYWAARIGEAGFRERECGELALEATAREAECRIIHHLDRVARNLIKKATLLLGFHPMTFKNSARHALVVVPPKIWHGIQNIGDETSCILKSRRRGVCIRIAGSLACPRRLRSDPVPVSGPETVTTA